MLNMDLRIPNDFSNARLSSGVLDPLTPGCGAVIRGLDVTNVTADTIDELKLALVRHGVLFIEGQNMTPDDQQSLAVRFGKLVQEPFVKALPAHPFITRLVKEADEAAPNTFGGVWHTDLPFLANPPAYTTLYGLDVPETGGDTLFANTHLAYRNLSKVMQDMLQPLQGVSSSSSYTGENASSHFAKMENMDMRLLSGGQTTAPQQAHPLITTHPLTGDRAIFMCPSSTKSIEGLSKSEATPILGFLAGYCTDPFFCCRYRWQKGTLAVWDNRVVLHRALSDFLGTRREMHRSIILAVEPD